MQSLLACHQAHRCGCSSIDDLSGNGPSIGCEGSCYEHAVDSLLRSAINDRDREPTLGLMVVLRCRFLQALLNKSCTYLTFSHHYHAFHLPPLPQPTTIVQQNFRYLLKTINPCFSLKKVHYRTHFPAPQEASARNFPHLLTNTLLIFLVACPVLILV